MGVPMTRRHSFSGPFSYSSYYDHRLSNEMIYSFKEIRTRTQEDPVGTYRIYRTNASNIFCLTIIHQDPIESNRRFSISYFKFQVDGSLFAYFQGHLIPFASFTELLSLAKRTCQATTIPRRLNIADPSSYLASCFAHCSSKLRAAPELERYGNLDVFPVSS